MVKEISLCAFYELPRPNSCQLVSGKPCEPCVGLATLISNAYCSTGKSHNILEDRHVLIKKINDRHDSLSYYLPFELISLIFAMYHEGYANLLQKPGTTIPRTPTPLLLAAVCRSWRDITFKIPSLWTSLCYVDSWHTHSECIEQWLCRSGTRPLSIRISLTAAHGYTEESKHSLAKFFAILKGYSLRWKFLNLSMPSKLCETFLGKLVVKAPLLETLQLSILDEAYTSTSPLAILATLRLTKVTTWRIWLTTVELEWANVTTLDSTMASIDEIFHILAHAPALTHCDFTSISDDSFVYTIPAALTHASLRSLKLYPDLYIEEDVMHTLFERLTLPALENLTYNFERSKFPFDARIFSSFLQRSGSLITYLALANLTFKCISSLEVMEILRSIPSVTNLHLDIPGTHPNPLGDWTSFPNEFFLRLATETTFLPNLEVLVYRHVKPHSEAWIDLEDAMINLAVALATVTKQVSSDSERTLRPLNSVKFTLFGNFPIEHKVIAFARSIYLRLLKAKAQGFKVQLMDETWGPGHAGCIDEYDLLQHFEASRTFYEFDEYPCDWFDI